MQALYWPLGIDFILLRASLTNASLLRRASAYHAHTHYNIEKVLAAKCARYCYCFSSALPYHYIVYRQSFSIHFAACRLRPQLPRTANTLAFIIHLLYAGFLLILLPFQVSISLPVMPEETHFVTHWYCWSQKPALLAFYCCIIDKYWRK